MRLFVIVVALATCSLGAIVVARTLSGPVAVRPQKGEPNMILVTGTGNTLEQVARRVNDPQRLDYDPIARRAVLWTNLIIEGELVLGSEHDPDSGQTVEIPNQVCSDVQIAVRPGASLRMYHSQIRTQRPIVCQGTCTPGYALRVDGALTMLDSRVSWLSGTRSQLLTGPVQATIKRSTFDECQGHALSLLEVDGGKVVLEDCDLMSNGDYGVVVRGSGGQPVQIQNCVLAGHKGAVLVLDDAAHLRVVDCVLGAGGVSFAGTGGQVVVAWTRQVKVVDPAGLPPAQPVLVQARAQGDDSDTILAEARTDAAGIARLILPEWIAKPAAPRKDPASNVVGPVRLTFQGAGFDGAEPLVLQSVSQKRATPIEMRLVSDPVGHAGDLPQHAVAASAG